MIKKEGNQWCLYTKDGSRKLGCHDSEEKAIKQEQAIEASKHSESQKKVVRTKDFIGKLKELLAGKIKDDELKSVISKARSHASAQARKGNKVKKEEENKKLEKKAAYEDYSGPKLEKTHGSVDYQQASKVGKTCGDCKFFYRYTSYDGTCQLVEGSISDINVCSLWEAIIAVASTELVSDWKLFNELSAGFQFAEPPDWIPFLPCPGKYESPKYGDVVISRERNENFVSNFSHAVYQEKIAIDAEHESKLSGAFGWITQMRMNDDGSVDAYVDWTETGTQAIKEDRFRYFSPEFYDSWKNPMTGEVHSDVAVGGALTTRPFFKEGALRPIIASEKGLTILEERGKDTYFMIPLKGGEEEMADEKKEDVTLKAKIIELLGLGKKEDDNDADVIAAKEKEEAEAKAKAIADAAAKGDAVAASELKMMAEITQLKEDAKKSQEKIKSLTESNSKLEKETRRKKFSETVGDSKEDLDFMESLASKFGEDSDEMKHYVKQYEAHKQQVKLAGIFSENGSTEIPAGGSAEAEFDTLAKKLMEEDKTGKLDYTHAFEKAMAENPQLYGRYVEESTQKV